MGLTPSGSNEAVAKSKYPLVDFHQSGLPPLRRPYDDRPARSVKTRRALRWRTMVAFHEEVGLLRTIAGESVFRNKISGTEGRSRNPCKSDAKRSTATGLRSKCPEPLTVSAAISLFASLTPKIRMTVGRVRRSPTSN